MGYKKRPSAGWAALWQNLQLDLEIRLDLLRRLDGVLQDGIKLVIVSLQQHFLGHKADACVLNAGQRLDGGLDAVLAGRLDARVSWEVNSPG